MWNENVTSERVRKCFRIKLQNLSQSFFRRRRTAEFLHWEIKRIVTSVFCWVTKKRDKSELWSLWLSLCYRSVKQSVTKCPISNPRRVFIYFKCSFTSIFCTSPVLVCHVSSSSTYMLKARGGHVFSRDTARSLSINLSMENMKTDRHGPVPHMEWQNRSTASGKRIQPPGIITALCRFLTIQIVKLHHCSWQKAHFHCHSTLN